MFQTFAKIVLIYIPAMLAWLEFFYYFFLEIAKAS